MEILLKKTQMMRLSVDAANRWNEAGPNLTHSRRPCWYNYPVVMLRCLEVGPWAMTARQEDQEISPS